MSLFHKIGVGIQYTYMCIFHEQIHRFALQSSEKPSIFLNYIYKQSKACLDNAL
jgi:hypothetical protein